MLYESLKDWKRYDFGPAWKEVMTWVDANIETIGLGSYEVAGCKVFVTEGPTRPEEGIRYECHRRMADVQIVLRGEENMYNLPAVDLTPVDPFDEDKDIGFFAEPIAYTPVRLKRGIFAVLFPWDAHMPSMAVDGVPSTVRKLLVKLPVDKLSL